MSYSIVVKRQPPYPPYACEFVTIDAESVPSMMYALTIKSQKYWWNDGMDAEVARWMLNKQKASFLMPCGNDIVNSIDRVYNLLDASIRGVSRSVSGEGTPIDPFVYDPILTQVTEPIEYFTPGIQWNTEKTIRALENLLNGTTSTNFTDPRNIRQQLEDILAAIQAEDFDPAEIENLLNLIILALA